MDKRTNVGLGLVAALGCGVLVVISVPMVGILAAIAIPNFVAMQMKAKRSEVPNTVNSIATAVLMYRAEHDALPGAIGAPAIPPGKELHPWAGGDDWDRLAWAPSTELRGVYWVEPTADGFVVVGRCDVDGDGVFAEYRSTGDGGATAISGPYTY